MAVTSEKWAFTCWKPLFLRVPDFPNSLPVPELRSISGRTADAPNGYQPEDDEQHRSAESTHLSETSAEPGLSPHGSNPRFNRSNCVL